MTTTALEIPSIEQIERQFIGAIAKPSERDKQIKIGPSSIGGCPYCLGYDMAAKLVEMPDREAEKFGYAAWLGTGLHYYLEHNLDLGVEVFRETKLRDIFMIPGYGSIGGSCDLMVPEWGRTFDFKFPGKWSYDKVQLALAKGRKALMTGVPLNSFQHMPSMQYRVQQQIYAQGWIQRGYDIRKTVLAFLPRHTNDIRDVILWEEDVNQDLYEGAVARAISVWEYVGAGQLGDIPSEAANPAKPDEITCYTCSTVGRGDLTTYNETLN